MAIIGLYKYNLIKIFFAKSFLNINILNIYIYIYKYMDFINSINE